MVFGDSLSAAYNLSVQQGWVHLVSRRIEAAGLPWQVVNASVTGETTTGGVRRIAEDLRRHQPAIVVIELGGNDALRGGNLAATRTNLDSMVGAAQDAGAKVLIVGMQLPPNYGAAYVRQFGSLFGDVA